MYIIDSLTPYQDGEIIRVYYVEEKFADGVYPGGFSVKFNFIWFPFDTQRINIPSMRGNGGKI